MLKTLTVRGFKSLEDVTLSFPRLTVLFGPNAAGKSNVLDAVQALSRFASSRTLADALADPIRGYPVEAFSFPPGGLAELLSGSSRRFELEADLDIKQETFRYRLLVQIEPLSAALSVADEYLARLRKSSAPSSSVEAAGTPAIQVVDGKIRLRRKSSGKPRYESVGQNFAMVSDLRLGEPEYRAVGRARAELSAWRTYYLDPRVSMRVAQPPAEVADIGVLGADIAPFLYRLRAERPKNFAAVRRTLSSVIPSVEDLVVDLDKRRGTLDILVRQDGTEFSSRIVSEGTLRVLALCAIAANPWGGTLLAFEEPENGVHPRRIELIAKLLFSLAKIGEKQVIVTTHSPLLCDAVMRLERESAGVASLLNVKRRGGKTVVEPFPLAGPLFDDDVREGLTAANEDGLFESMSLRGFLDE
jgi:predicted ATPase